MSVILKQHFARPPAPALCARAHGAAPRLRPAGGDPSRDASGGQASDLARNFRRQAAIAFGRFHVIKLAGEAVDDVRRRESRSDPSLEGSRYIWLANPGNLAALQALQMAAFEGSHLDAMQACQIRLNLQDAFKMGEVAAARRLLERWNSWVKISALEPMIKVAATIMERAADILRAIETGLSDGFLEAIDAWVQAAKRMAKGYRIKRNLKTIIHMVAGGVLDAPPT